MIHKKAEESWTNAHENNLAGQFPLHHACRDGNSEELQRLLTELQNNVSNAEILIAEDPYYNWTAGHFAAYFGNVSSCLVYFILKPISRASYRCFSTCCSPKAHVRTAVEMNYLIYVNLITAWGSAYDYERSRINELQ